MTASPVGAGDLSHQLPSARWSERSDRSSLRAGIVPVALEHLGRWRPGGGNAPVDRSPAAVAILRAYYRVGVGIAVADADLQSMASRRAHPLSAVFVSCVMQTAGAPAGVLLLRSASDVRQRAAASVRKAGLGMNPVPTRRSGSGQGAVARTPAGRSGDLSPGAVAPGRSDMANINAPAWFAIDGRGLPRRFCGAAGPSGSQSYQWSMKGVM